MTASGREVTALPGDVAFAPPTSTWTPDRAARVKRGYASRLVPGHAITALVPSPAGPPQAGDLVLARVEQVGKLARLELRDSRRALLFPGDELVLAYGHRYAPDLLEAEVPDDLGPCELVSEGGVAGRILCSVAKLGVSTHLQPLGLLAAADGAVLNVRDAALPRLGSGGVRPPTIAFAGTAMNAGKTTSAAALILGLVRAGHRVGAAKVTGTGAGGDPWLMRDAGAAPVLDFTSAGHASTYRLDSAEVLDVLTLLTGHLAAAGVDVVVLEISDGVFQGETAALLADPRFAAAVDGIVFAGRDALGAVAGVRRLRSAGLPVLAVSGVLTASPLAAREARLALDGLLVLGPGELSHPLMAQSLLDEVRADAFPALAGARAQ